MNNPLDETIYTQRDIDEWSRSFLELKHQRDALLAACEALLSAWDGYEMTAALDVNIRNQTLAAIAAARGEPVEIE